MSLNPEVRFHLDLRFGSLASRPRTPARVGSTTRALRLQRAEPRFPSGLTPRALRPGSRTRPDPPRPAAPRHAPPRPEPTRRDPPRHDPPRLTPPPPRHAPDLAPILVSVPILIPVPPHCLCPPNPGLCTPSWSPSLHPVSTSPCLPPLSRSPSRLLVAVPALGLHCTPGLRLPTPQSPFPVSHVGSRPARQAGRCRTGLQPSRERCSVRGVPASHARPVQSVAHLS